ncbi:hypothetical protein OAA91_00695 [Fibrobacterales bacterium]|nr:hypothetical protein [Fibrobacterales bacterium]
MTFILVFISILFFSCGDSSQKNQTLDVNAIQKAPDFSPTGKYEVQSDQFFGKLVISENGTFLQTIFKPGTTETLKELSGNWNFNLKQEIDSYMDDRIFPIILKDSVWNYEDKTTVAQHSPRLLLSQKGDVKILISGNKHYWKKI